MPARMDPQWIEKVKSIKANERARWGAPRITRALEEEAAREGRYDCPSERAVSSILRKIAAEDLREYRFLYWPDTFERGDLPWEASEAALELLALKEFAPGEARPSVRLARWFWRITQAAPRMLPAERRRLAGLVITGSPRRVEAMLLLLQPSTAAWNRSQLGSLARNIFYPEAAEHDQIDLLALIDGFGAQAAVEMIAQAVLSTEGGEEAAAAIIKLASQAEPRPGPAESL